MKKAVFIVCLVVICLFSACGKKKDPIEDTEPEIVLPSIYGCREGAEFLAELIKENRLRLFSFNFLNNRKDKAILIHLAHLMEDEDPDDGLSNEMAIRFFGKTLLELNNETEDHGVLFEKRTIFNQPCLVISAVDTQALENEYNTNSTLRESIQEIIKAKSNPIPDQDQDILWQSSGHEPKIFLGLFKNPDYSKVDQFLVEDELTTRTEQVMTVAGIIDVQKNESTLKEIYTLLRVIEQKAPTPNKIFEVSASQILSTPVIGGCTTFATAFSTLCRAKGIPAVVVDSAEYGWILEGCMLGYVRGHFFVEVFIDDTWYLVDSTAGRLYEGYNRNNWFLPDGYIAFTKSLSFIDPGTSEKNHNLLQRVAFVNKKDIIYRSPNYGSINLFDPNIMDDLKHKYEQLKLVVDNELNIQIDGEIREIRADPSPIDFSNIY